MTTLTTNGLDLAKILTGEIIREIIGASTYDPKIGKVEKILSEKIGPERLESFERSLAAASRRGSDATGDANGAWKTFVKSLEGVNSERTGSQHSLKLKLKPDRKQEIQTSMKTNILEGLSIYEYRMAILCEALKTALDSKESGNFDHRGLGGNTVLHFLAAFPIDTKERQTFSVNVIELLVENNIDFLIQNDKRLTALHIITGNHILDPRKNFEPSPSRRGLDCTTSINGRYKILCCFKMDRSFDVRGPYGNSILHEWVVQRAICGHEENDDRNRNDEERIGKWIIDVAGVSPNKTNDYGCTSLHYAFRIHLIRFLCKNGAEKDRQSDSGETPLMYILKHCFLRGFVGNVLPPECDLETTLSSCLGIRKNGDMNIEEIVAFHLMTLKTLEKSLKNLADAGFDLNHEKDGRNEDRDCLDYLLCILRECVCEGCKEKNGQQFKTFKCLLKCVGMLIANGAILSGEKAGRKSPLHQILLFYFDSLEMLHVEIRTQIVKCVEMMLEAFADPNTQDSNGNTVLHFCCQKVDPRDKQQKQLIEHMREYGASLTIENNNGDTPTKILENRDNQQCTKLAKNIETLKPRQWVKVDFQSERYKDGLDNLCRTKCPQRVGSLRYNLEHIGKGAMSFIYLAVDEKSKREVALKRIIKASFEKELQNEIKSLVKLEQNSNIVKYFCCLTDDPIFYFLSLELMEGDLSYLVREYKSLKLNLDDEVTLNLSTDLVKGLTFLHHQQILHRDLKPGNILYRLDGDRKLCLKLADFGLAKHLTPSVNQSTVLSGSTSTSSLTGTRGWMAPELVRREVQEHSKDTDIFALGLVLHFLISKGFHPFDKSGTPLSAAVGSGTLKPHELETGICKGKPEHLWKDLTPEAKHLMELLLSDDPSQRPSAEDLLNQNCYFCSKLKKVEFMKTVGDQREIARPSRSSPVELKLEGSPFGDQVRTNSWEIELPDLWNEMSPIRSYRTEKVVDLIRFFRNAYAHFQERSPTCKVQLLNEIFFAKYPDFFLTVWKVVRDDMSWLKKNSGRDWLLRVVNEMS